MSLTIPEKRYTALPASIAKNFEPARTVRVGSVSIKLLPVEKV